MSLGGISFRDAEGQNCGKTKSQLKQRVSDYMVRTLELALRDKTRHRNSVADKCGWGHRNSRRGKQKECVTCLKRDQ